MDYSKLIVEVFEKENPTLMSAVKQAVEAGESRDKFEAFAKSVIPDHKTSLVFSLSMTAFDYYQQENKRAKIRKIITKRENL